MPDGCRFHPRCPFAVDGVCDVMPIPLEVARDGALVRCVRHTELDLRDPVDVELAP
jgi:ABC-type dipeptide/oligopeptide/nickel transport system ATPase component